LIDFAVEPLIAARPDIESLVPAQWAHTGEPDIPCRPNWPLYHQFADRGALLVVMARDLDEAVGYLSAFIYPHPNSVGTSIASIPTYFVRPGPTRALIMARMVDFALQRLAERGVYRVDIDTNAEFSAGRLWELKGFKLRKLGYSLELKKPAGERHA
jgi:GNAT superfamily N-acetyltransferase